MLGLYEWAGSCGCGLLVFGARMMVFDVTHHQTGTLSAFAMYAGAVMVGKMLGHISYYAGR